MKVSKNLLSPYLEIGVVFIFGTLALWYDLGSITIVSIINYLIIPSLIIGVILFLVTLAYVNKFKKSCDKARVEAKIKKQRVGVTSSAGEVRVMIILICINLEIISFFFIRGITDNYLIVGLFLAVARLYISNRYLTSYYMKQRARLLMKMFLESMQRKRMRMMVEKGNIVETK